MFHTDFKKLIDAIKQQEQRELKQALEAHDGSYVFPCNDDAESPRITVVTHGFIEEVFFMDVTEVLIENDKVFIKGTAVETSEEIEIPADQAYTGELGYLIDLIEPTKTCDSTMAYNYHLFEDIIDLQEISTQAVNEIMNKIDCDRFTAFEKCQEWAEEFTKKFRNHNWGDDDMSYYDHIDFFVEQKLKEL